MFWFWLVWGMVLFGVRGWWFGGFSVVVVVLLSLMLFWIVVVGGGGGGLFSFSVILSFFLGIFRYSRRIDLVFSFFLGSGFWIDILCEKDSCCCC